MDPSEVAADLWKQTEEGRLRPAKRSDLLGAPARGLTAEDLEEEP